MPVPTSSLSIIIVLAYIAGFGLLVYRRSHSAAEEFEEKGLSTEPIIPAAAEIPIMPPPPRSVRISASTASVYPPTVDPRMSFKSAVRPMWLDEDPAIPKSAVSVATRSQWPEDPASSSESDAASKKSRSSRSSARLPKRLPETYF